MQCNNKRLSVMHRVQAVLQRTRLTKETVEPLKVTVAYAERALVRPACRQQRHRHSA
jgi:hypothetical protein